MKMTHVGEDTNKERIKIKKKNMFVEQVKMGVTMLEVGLGAVASKYSKGGLRHFSGRWLPGVHQG